MKVPGAPSPRQRGTRKSGWHRVTRGPRGRRPRRGRSTARTHAANAGGWRAARRSGTDHALLRHAPGSQAPPPTAQSLPADGGCSRAGESERIACAVSDRDGHRRCASIGMRRPHCPAPSRRPA
eukprot:6715292-Prymnesium_polylepis.1